MCSLQKITIELKVPWIRERLGGPPDLKRARAFTIICRSISEIAKGFTWGGQSVLGTRV